mmetsp:Transcript_9396/g.11799  ORF Transcript_9396/g.11799 Transcript_9396/m.11799 type:complete len:87 (-) Transcript_9396:254-514(-)
MKLAAKASDVITDEEKQAAEYNKEAKRLESYCRLHVPSTFQEQLETALEEIGAYFPDRLTEHFSLFYRLRYDCVVWTTFTKPHQIH